MSDGLPTEPAVGDELAGYRLEAVIRDGATGTIFRATSPDGTAVALKLLSGSFADDEVARGRLEREALAGVLANHPNCVSVLDLQGLPDGRMFLVLEHVEGELLSELVARQGRLDVDRALRIVRHVLTGLAHAHDSDIIHRGIEPANVVLTDVDGDPDFVRIMDFGIAKLKGSAGAGQVDLTRGGQTLGNPSYSAPEALSSKPVDPRADLYSVASVLYELLTGRPPFTSDDPVKVFQAVVSAQPPAFADDLSIPKRVEELVLRGLAKSPDERFASAAEFIAAIDALSAPEPADEGDTTPEPAAHTEQADGVVRAVPSSFDKTVGFGTLEPMVRPGTPKPSAAPKPATPPATEQPATEQPATEQPATEQPATEQPPAAPPPAPSPSWPTSPPIGLRAQFERLRQSRHFGWIMLTVFVFLVAMFTALFTATD
jgi:serine/threonine-protein kinase